MDPVATTAFAYFANEHPALIQAARALAAFRQATFTPTLSLDVTKDYVRQGLEDSLGLNLGSTPTEVSPNSFGWTRAFWLA